MAALLNMQRSYYSELESGSRPISSKVIRVLTELKPVSTDWLLTGFGSMLMDKHSLDDNFNKIERFKHDLKSTNERLYNVYCDLGSVKYLSNSLNIFLQTIEVYDSIDLSRFNKDMPSGNPLTLEYDEFYKMMLEQLEKVADSDKAFKVFVIQLTNFLATVKPLDVKNKLPNFNSKFWPKK